MRRAFLIAGLTLLTASCAGGINVKTDYNKQVNLARYHTFAIRDGHSTGNAVMDQRIKSDVEAALRARGMDEARAGQPPDAIVVAHAATRTERSYDTFYNNW